jgi:hypothetical protein
LRIAGELLQSLIFDELMKTLDEQFQTIPDNPEFPAAILNTDLQAVERIGITRFRSYSLKSITPMNAAFIDPY